MITVALLITLAGAAEPDAEWMPGLSDRELAIQRWFSHLTYMQGHEADPWVSWYDDGNQLGNSAYRYQIAFCGYACAAMAARTPAYRELVSKQLGDLCERMIDRRVWGWTPRFWDYGGDPPDPCKYENVMYTGHLTQLMCLYELFTGDPRYSDAGWEFTWTDGRSVPYTLEKAIRGLYDQSVASPTGGICCEPGRVFADCNSHSALSFQLHDLLHGTHYAAANPRWFDWMRVNFRNQIPFSGVFLYVVYDQRQGIFIPVGDPGADCWALGWGYPWFPDPGFAREGWSHLYVWAKWRHPRPDQWYLENNAVISCCGGGTLGMSNAFIPLLGVQAAGIENQYVQGILNWLESEYGKPLDTDNDGYEESYSYQTCQVYRISATANIVTALVTAGDSLRALYSTPRAALRGQPAVAHVDYPNVYVRAAEYRAPVLRFELQKGTPSFAGTTEILLENLPPETRVTRDGTAWEQCSWKDGALRIVSDVEAPHVFTAMCPEQRPCAPEKK